MYANTFLRRTLALRRARCLRLLKKSCLSSAQWLSRHPKARVLRIHGPWVWWHQAERWGIPSAHGSSSLCKWIQSSVSGVSVGARWWRDCRNRIDMADDELRLKVHPPFQGVVLLLSRSPFYSACFFQCISAFLGRLQSLQGSCFSLSSTRLCTRSELVCLVWIACSHDAHNILSCFRHNSIDAQSESAAGNLPSAVLSRRQLSQYVTKSKACIVGTVKKPHNLNETFSSHCVVYYCIALYTMSVPPVPAGIISWQAVLTVEHVDSKNTLHLLFCDFRVRHIQKWKYSFLFVLPRVLWHFHQRRAQTIPQATGPYKRWSLCLEILWNFDKVTILPLGTWRSIRVSAFLYYTWGHIWRFFALFFTLFFIFIRIASTSTTAIGKNYFSTCSKRPTVLRLSETTGILICGIFVRADVRLRWLNVNRWHNIIILFEYYGYFLKSQPTQTREWRVSAAE